MGIPARKFACRRTAAGQFVVRACAAAVCGVFSLSAMGQAPVDQVQVGLERALKTPLEIVWLRTATEADMWNQPALSQTAEGCGKTASPKFGCAVVGRTAWRYIFGGNAQFAPRPNDVARLVVSSLNLPEAPMTAGKLDLSGSGRLYIVTPEGAPGVRPTKVAVILAAGSSLQISDTASPSIQIELKAPENEPLLLGNLAAADIGKMLALLVKPGVVKASEASMNVEGRVALRSGGEVQLGSLVSTPGRVDVPVAITQIARVEPPAVEEATPDFTPLAAGIEARGTKIEFTHDFTQMAAVLESPTRTPAAEQVPSPVQVAMAAPMLTKAPTVVTAAVAAAPAPAQSSAHIARMRAEIEAEIARDRDRLAQPRTAGAPGAKRFVLGV